MYVGRDVDGSDVGDRSLKVDDRLTIDAVIHTERPLGRVDIPTTLGPGKDRLFVGSERIRPHRFPANAVLVPSLERSAATRPFVILARPFVVALGHFIKHSRADPLETRLRI